MKNGNEQWVTKTRVAVPLGMSLSILFLFTGASDNILFFRMLFGVCMACFLVAFVIRSIYFKRNNSVGFEYDYSSGPKPALNAILFFGTVGEIFVWWIIFDILYSILGA